MTEILEPEGEPLLDATGDRVGRIDTVYVDPASDAPQWALVSTGLFGARRTMVPLEAARRATAGIQVPYPRTAIRDAPRGGDEDELSVELEEQLRRHYDTARRPFAVAVEDPAPAPSAGGKEVSARLPGADWQAAIPALGGRVDAAPPGPIPSDPRRAETTLNAERLTVGATLRPAEVVRLRKRVVSEPVVERVTLRREVLRVERRPVEASAAPVPTTPDLVEEEWELTLMREEPTLTKRVVPIEHIRVGRSEISEEAVVEDELHHEELDSAGVEAVPLERRFADHPEA